jgi:hypothetical protein
MSAVEKLLEQARRLSPSERRRLLARLERSLSRKPARPRRSGAEGPYTRSLALAGTVHTRFRDVSSSKYRHVAEAAAASRRGR